MLTKPLIGIVGALALLCWWFYTMNLQLKNDLQVSIIKTEAAETSLRTAQQERQLLDTQLEQFAAKTVEIERERDEARAQVDGMKDMFQDHDFANLLTKKPGLVSKLMVKKTREVFDEIEALTAD